MGIRKRPAGGVSLEWQSVDLELGLSAGWNTLPGVWQFGARAGAGMVVAMSDSVYLNVGGTHKGVFTGLNPSSVAPRVKAEVSVGYRRLELGLDAIDDFGDLDGTPSGTIKAWGVGIELAYFWH